MEKRCERSQGDLVLLINFPVCFSEIPLGAHQCLWAGWLLRGCPGTLRWVPSTVGDVPSQAHINFCWDLWFSPQWAPADIQLLILSSGMTLSWFALGSIAPAQPSLCFVGSECWGSFWVCYSSSLRASFAVITQSTARLGSFLWMLLETKSVKSLSVLLCLCVLCPRCLNHLELFDSVCDLKLFIWSFVSHVNALHLSLEIQ